MSLETVHTAEWLAHNMQAFVPSEESCLLREQAFKARLGRQGAMTPASLRAAAMLHLAEAEIGRGAAAVAAQRELVRRMQSTAGIDAALIAEQRSWLAMVLVSAGQDHDALDPARSAFGELLLLRGPEDALTVGAESILGLALLRTGRIEEAQKHIESSIRGAQGYAAGTTPMAAEHTYTRLMHAHLAQERWSEAADMVEQQFTVGAGCARADAPRDAEDDGPVRISADPNRPAAGAGGERFGRRVARDADAGRG